MSEFAVGISDLNKQMSGLTKMLAQNGIQPAQQQQMANQSQEVNPNYTILFDKEGKILRRGAGQTDFVALDDHDRRICVTLSKCPLDREVYTLLYAYKNDGFIAQVSYPEDNKDKIQTILGNLQINLLSQSYTTRQIRPECSLVFIMHSYIQTNSQEQNKQNTRKPYSIQ